MNPVIEVNVMAMITMFSVIAPKAGFSVHDTRGRSKLILDGYHEAKAIFLIGTGRLFLLCNNKLESRSLKLTQQTSWRRVEINLS